MKRITVVQCDDWEALYIGNELHRQDTDGIYFDEWQQLFNDLEVDVEIDIIQDDALDDYLLENGNLPETLRELKKLIK